MIRTGLAALAFATLPIAAFAQVGNPAHAKVSMCIGCHGIPDYRVAYPTVYSVPKIGGQNEKYIENALKAYRSGDRQQPTMQAIAGSLSDQDIADLAAYFSAKKKN